MSKLDTKEFAAAINMKIATVRAHISRKKLDRDDSGFIDTELEKNRLYINEQTNGKGLFSNSSGPGEPSSETPKPGSNQKEIVFKDKRTPEQKKRDKDILDVELKKKQIDLESAEYSAQLKKLELEKKAGKLLPIELAQKIMSINIQAVFRNFESEAENIAGIFTEVLGGTREDLADIIGRVRVSLKESIEKAKDDSAKEISAAIDDYADTRSRGEKK